MERKTDAEISMKKSLNLINKRIKIWCNSCEREILKSNQKRHKIWHYNKRHLFKFCSVFKENFLYKGKTSFLCYSCNQYFHKRCIPDWMEQKGECFKCIAEGKKDEEKMEEKADVEKKEELEEENTIRLLRTRERTRKR